VLSSTITARRGIHLTMHDPYGVYIAASGKRGGRRDDDVAHRQ
jgi:hypothetical protein